MKIGILALQGAFYEHAQSLKQLHEPIEPVYVKTPDDLENLSGIILPGGESTAMRKQLDSTGLFKALQSKIQNGFPVWGTCAGLILLSKHLEDGLSTHLSVMDIRAKRNAYGRQLGSFQADVAIPCLEEGTPFPMFFIRAPYITACAPSVSILCEYNGFIVAAREKHMLATAFHPELTDDLRFHKYFVQMCHTYNS